MYSICFLMVLLCSFSMESSASTDYVGKLTQLATEYDLIKVEQSLKSLSVHHPLSRVLHESSYRLNILDQLYFNATQVDLQPFIDCKKQERNVRAFNLLCTLHNPCYNANILQCHQEWRNEDTQTVSTIQQLLAITSLLSKQVSKASSRQVKQSRSKKASADSRIDVITTKLN